MIDPGGARLEAFHAGGINRGQQAQIDWPGKEQAGNDGSKGGVFRHVFSVFLVVAIRRVPCVSVVMFMMSGGQIRVVMMNLKLAQGEMGVPDREAQCDAKEEQPALTKKSHRRRSITLACGGGQPRRVDLAPVYTPRTDVKFDLPCAEVSAGVISHGTEPTFPIARRTSIETF